MFTALLVMATCSRLISWRTCSAASAMHHCATRRCPGHVHGPCLPQGLAATKLRQELAVQAIDRPFMEHKELVQFILKRYISCRPGIRALQGLDHRGCIHFSQCMLYAWDLPGH